MFTTMTLNYNGATGQRSVACTKKRSLNSKSYLTQQVMAHYDFSKVIAMRKVCDINDEVSDVF